MDAITYLVLMMVGIVTLSATAGILLLPCRAFLPRRFLYELHLVALQLVDLVELNRFDQQPIYRDRQMLISFNRRLESLDKAIDFGDDDRESNVVAAAAIGLVSGDETRLSHGDRYKLQLLRSYYGGVCLDRNRVCVERLDNITRYKVFIRPWILIECLEIARQATNIWDTRREAVN